VSPATDGLGSLVDFCKTSTLPKKPYCVDLILAKILIVGTSVEARKEKTVIIEETVVDIWNTHIAKMVLIVLFLVFIGSSAFFALKLQPAIIPDEPHHFQVSIFFSTTWGIPADTITTLPYGVINHWPFLSYWINGRALNLLNWLAPAVSDTTELVVLRLLNVIFSTVSVLFCYLLAKEIIKSRWGQIFVVFLLITTLMFVFLSGGNSYDNLMNLCSFAGIYYLTRVFKRKPFYKNSLLWLISILFGSLVKSTMLPLAAITGLLWFVYIVKNRQTINFRFTWDLKAISISLICIALFAINFAIYGVNIIKYRTLYPACTQVFTEEQCMNYPQYVREQDLGLGKKLSLVDVVHSGYPDPVEYGFDYWLPVILQRIYGIFGHQSYGPDLILTFHRMLILWTILITIRYWQKPSYTIASLYIILFFYILVVFLNSYNTELVFGFKGVGIQGRYLFPVIGIYYTMIVYYFCKVPNSILRWLTFGPATILFLYGSPIVFLLRFYSSTFSSWFM
jgi:hypothetical protein